MSAFDPKRTSLMVRWPPYCCRRPCYASATLIKQKAEALLVCSSPSFYNRRDQLVALTARHNIPAAYELREYATAGALLSYGNSLPDVYRARILTAFARPASGTRNRKFSARD